MGTLLLGKVKPLTNEPTLPSTFCSAAGQEGVGVSKVTQQGVIHNRHINIDTHMCAHKYTRWRFVYPHMQIHPVS